MEDVNAGATFMLKMRDFREKTSLSVKTSKIGEHCVKWDVGTKVLTHLLLPCGGLLGRWCHLSTADNHFNHDEREREHPASRRPVKGVSLPFIRYTQRSP